MVSNANAGDAAAPKAGNQPLSGSMNPGPVIDSSNTKQGSDPTASSGYPIPKTVQPERAVEGTNREIDHGAELTKGTGKAFTQGKVDGEAQGEKHLDSSLNKQSAPSGASKIKEVSPFWLVSLSVPLRSMYVYFVLCDQTSSEPFDLSQRIHHVCC